MKRPVLEIRRVDTVPNRHRLTEFVVEVDGDDRRWFATEKEAEAFVDGFQNCYDHLTPEGK